MNTSRLRFVVLLVLITFMLTIVSGICVTIYLMRGKYNLLARLDKKDGAQLVSFVIDDHINQVSFEDREPLAYLEKALRSAYFEVIMPGKVRASRLCHFEFSDGSTFQCTLDPFSNNEGFRIYVFVNLIDEDATEYDVPFSKPIPENIQEQFQLMSPN